MIAVHRVGLGFDLHPLVKGRPLWLGGVEIPFELGLKGHSDADVLLHSLMDALLGAAGLKDIGHYFPPGEPRYRDVSSMSLLQDTYQMLAGRGYRVVNVDTVIVAQEPRLAPYTARMVANIAGVLKIAPDQVSVKASTTEGLGICGQGKAIAAQAVVLIAGD